MDDIRDDNTENNRAEIWQQLYIGQEHADEDGILWIDYAGAGMLILLTDLGLLEQDFAVPSIDENADNWRKYFKRRAFRITERGNKVLKYRRRYIQGGLPHLPEE